MVGGGGVAEVVVERQDWLVSGAHPGREAGLEDD
jgi:hypothetical protein